MPDKHVQLTVVVNGQPTQVEVNPNAPLNTVVGRALSQTNNEGQPPENWEFRDAAGAPVDGRSKVSELGLSDNDRVFLNLKAGIGGCDSSVR